MTRLILSAVAILSIWSCSSGENNSTLDRKHSLTEFSDLYSEPTSEKIYSRNVGDTFQIFKSLPKGFSTDSAKKYPVIIILDANAFFESVVSQLKFNSFIGQIPESIIVGIGYKDFRTMDSLRTRDFTFPTAIPEYEMSLSGGAGKFRKFIDEELIARLTRGYRIDLTKSVLCGHSLGGYFSLFYGLKSIEENSYVVQNVVSASPSLHYNNRYLFEMEKSLRNASKDVPLKIYVSMGSEDMADAASKGILDDFGTQISERAYPGLKIKTAEYTSFGHIDAALPGFIKGLAYVFEE